MVTSYFKFVIKQFKFRKKVYTISSLESETLGAHGKATVYGVVSSISTTSDYDIVTRETRVSKFGSRNSRLKLVYGYP